MFRDEIGQRGINNRTQCPFAVAATEWTNVTLCIKAQLWGSGITRCWSGFGGGGILLVGTSGWAIRLYRGGVSAQSALHSDHLYNIQLWFGFSTKNVTCDQGFAENMERKPCKPTSGSAYGCIVTYNALWMCPDTDNNELSHCGLDDLPRSLSSTPPLIIRCF